MNKISILTLLLFTGFFSFQSSFGQMKKLKGLSNDIRMSPESSTDLDVVTKWKYQIDMVASNPESAEKCATYGWKAIVYNMIASLPDSLRRTIDTDNSAAIIAGKSAVKFYSFSTEEQEELETNLVLYNFLPNTIIACYNAGSILSAEKNNFVKVKECMSIVEKLLEKDTSQMAVSNGVSQVKAIYAVFRSAYTDSLVDQEIIYLERLAKYPNYLNDEVFIRLSMIYSDRKEYDKAMKVLEDGIAKIPQKTGTFIEQQINIELARGNQEAILQKFDAAIKENPENSSYYFSRGVTFHQLKLMDVTNYEKEYKAGNKNYKFKYFFSQALKDYNTAIELDGGNMPALYNLAVLYRDSSDLLYKSRMRVPPTDPAYNYFSENATKMYKATLEKFEMIRQSGFLKGNDLILLLTDMKACASRIQDRELAKKYELMIKEEKARLRASE